MFHGAYTHINSVIERLYRTYGFDNIHQDEAKEWAWEYLSSLGRLEAFEDRLSEIEITDHLGELPIGIVEGGIKGIRDKTTQVMLIPSSDIFIEGNKASSSAISGVISAITYTGDAVQLGDTVELTTNYAGVSYNISNNSLATEEYTYRLQGDYILCGLTTATLEIAYKSFPIWDDYTPKIPDDSKVIRGLVVFLAWMLVQRDFIKGKVSKQVYDMIETEYCFVVGAARNRLIQPDLAQMESIRRMSQRLLSKPGQYEQGFKYLNSEERLA